MGNAGPEGDIGQRSAVPKWANAAAFAPDSVVEIRHSAWNDDAGNAVGVKKSVTTDTDNRQPINSARDSHIATRAVVARDSDGAVVVGVSEILGW
jgi:hypothetical protein